LKLSVASDSFEISVHDNGRGFDPATVSMGNGLLNLQQRMVECGGRFEVQSSVGNGTTVRLIVPLSKM
jgi:two-component system sensor histidine kinase UhpB